MVTRTDSTEIITDPKLNHVEQPSFKRWLKHFCYLPASKRYFSKMDQNAIAEAVKQAEQGHVGEIQVVIEGYIPMSQAYTLGSRQRAEMLFAELGVWDTEYNSGVLIYLNLCEKKVELVIDRGIQQATSQQDWESICSHMIDQLKHRNFKQGVIQGVTEVGEILNRFYDGKVVDMDNELSNHPIIIN